MKRRTSVKNWSLQHFVTIWILVIVTGIAIIDNFPDFKRNILIVLILGSFVFLYYFVKSYKLIAKRPLNPNMVEIDYMRNGKFEQYLKPLFEAQGYSAVITDTNEKQGNLLILTRKNKKTLVKAECPNTNLDNARLQQVILAIKRYQADHVIIVTNQYFTKQAKRFAKENRVKLIDRDDLIIMVTSHKNGTPSFLERLLAAFNLRLDRD